MWVAVAKETDLVPERACVVRAANRELALLCTRDGVFAMDNACPHSGGSLGDGLVQGDVVTCPLHGWQFECRSGRSLTEKRANQRLYAVRREAGAVLVEVPDADAPADAPDEVETWIEVADAAGLQPGSLRTLQVGGRALLLACTAAGVFALENACAHEGASLAEGTLDDRQLTCPRHAYRFDLTSGGCLSDSRLKQRTYETKVAAGKVYLRAAVAQRSAAATPPVAGDPATRRSPVEVWKATKHGLDVWPDVERYAREKTSMSKIEEAELERMKWYGFFYRKNNDNDRYMVRVRIPGCEMSADQARALAHVAHRSGYNILDVTTRGNVQIQGLTVDALPKVRATLERAALTSRQSGHDNVRNVTSHPWSGIDPEELIDTRELARAIQELVIDNRELSDLPRKVNVALTGRAEAPAHAWTQDISYVAARGPEGHAGFCLLLGGNQGQAPKLGWHIPVFVRREQVVGVTRAVLCAFRELGYRHNRQQVRLRHLIERIGPDGLLLEIEKRLGRALARFPQSLPKSARAENFVGWFAQRQQGLWAVGVCVPVGRLSADELEGLGVVARRFGDGSLRTTYDQNLILPGIPEALREEAGYAIARHGLTFEPDPAVRNMVACTGKQFCNIAVTETKGYAYQLIEDLRRRRVQLHGIRVAMSGCPSSCAMSYTADVGLKGVKIRRGVRVLDAFDVYLGGGVGERVAMGTLFQKGVPVDQVAELIGKVASDFHLQRSRGETFSSFWQRKLKGHKAEPLAVERPEWLCSRCGHRQVATDPPPFCPICAALRAKFVPAPSEVEAAAAAAPRPGASEADQSAPAIVRPGRRVVVVGGGIAAHAFAEALHALEPNARVALVTDERHSFYNRLNLTRFIAQEVRRDELFDYGPSWYEGNGVTVSTGTRVIALDPVKKLALLAAGRELEYDVCLLGHGSSASVPPFFREGVSGLVALRTLEDVEQIVERARPGARVAVIGGGVLGLEAAYGLRRRGADVRVLEYLPRLMPRQLDSGAASLLADHVRDNGIAVETSASVEQVLGADRVTGLKLADGRQLDCELIVVSTGIRPNVDWVKRSGIRCQRGVLVDDRMATSAPDVYAAGDVVEWRGQVVGLWANALEQARVAAANAAGRTAFYQGTLPVTVLKCAGLPLVSLGEIAEDGGPVTSSLGREAGIYRRVIFRRGLPIGGILLGGTSGMGELRRLVENGLELEKLRDRVVPEPVTSHA
jgi:ferredoxin-nitrite reductase